MKPKVYVTRKLPQVALDELKVACEVTIWEYESPAPGYEVINDQIGDKEGLLCLLTDRIDAALMDSAPHLKVISQCAVGYDNIDIEAARVREIAVGNTPGVLTDATADFTFTLLMSAARRINEAISYVRDGHWQTWGLTILQGQDVWGATLGIVGLGRIGQAVAKRAHGFGMRIFYSDRERKIKIENELGVKYVSFDELLRVADFVSLHIPLTDQTKDLIGTQEFDWMKKDAILINTSRGQVIDMDALYAALTSGQIAGAALDVTDPEPLPADHRLLELPNLLVTPHIASATTSARTRMAQVAVRNLVAGVQGKPLIHAVHD